MKKDDFDIKIFASRFSQLLNESQENTHSLAKKLGLNPGTISRYANGLMAPKVPTLYALADIFDVNPIWLLGFDVPKHEDKSNNKQNTNLINHLTPDEVKLITVYRKNPDIRAKIQAFLEVNGEPLTPAPTRTIKIAAYGGGVIDHETTATDEQIQDALDEGKMDPFPLKPNK